MADYYLVRLARGAARDHSVPRRQQGGWAEHAVFMDALVDEGMVVLGGPVGDGDGEDSLLVVDIEHEGAIRPSSRRHGAGPDRRAKSAV